MRLGDLQGYKKSDMKLSVICLLVLMSAVSCSPKIYPVQRDTVNIVHTEVKEVLKDTVIYVTLPQDSLSVSTRDTSSVLRIKTAVSEASVSGGVLHHSLYSNPAYRPEIEVQYKDKVIYRDSVVYATNIDLVEVPAELSGWQKLMMSGGYILMGFLLLAVILAVLRWRKVL